MPNFCLGVGQVLHVGWGDTRIWDGIDHLWMYMWIDENTTDWMLYKGFHDAGARCIGARIVQKPSMKEPLGIGAVAFRQVSLV
jgi:hypothetical protein